MVLQERAWLLSTSWALLPETAHAPEAVVPLFRSAWARVPGPPPCCFLPRLVSRSEAAWGRDGDRQVVGWSQAGKLPPRAHLPGLGSAVFRRDENRPRQPQCYRSSGSPLTSRSEGVLASRDLAAVCKVHLWKQEACYSSNVCTIEGWSRAQTSLKRL